MHKRADIERVLTRRTDWARRIAVIVVALAAAAATFFLFSPMAKCDPKRAAVHAPVPVWQTARPASRP